MDDKWFDRTFSAVFVIGGVIALTTITVLVWGVVTLVNWLVTK